MVSGSYGALWVYLIAPMLGSIVGWGLYRILMDPEDEISVEIEDDDVDVLDEDDLLDDDE